MKTIYYYKVNAVFHVHSVAADKEKNDKYIPTQKKGINPMKMKNPKAEKSDNKIK